MNENVLIFLMCVWALSNFFACLAVICRRYPQTIQQQKKWERTIKISVFFNLGVTLVIENGMLQHFNLLLLMIVNILLASWSVKTVRRYYEKKLRQQEFAFQIERIKHNVAHGVVEIDGIKYHAFIPPVWIKESQDEKGQLIPGTYKRYRTTVVENVRFKRFVPVNGGNKRLMVELG